MFPRIKLRPARFLRRPFPALVAPSLLGMLLAGVTAGVVRAYDPPNFVSPLFSADGIFLAAEEKSALLEALAAIASNFPNNSRVDSDLREKALALALQLDPLHYNSRLAHRDLSVGATPKPTAFFDNLSSISETLWNMGTRLASPPLDPEEKRLAPLLLELSLLTHPEPTSERLEAFGLACDRKPPEWEPVTDLQRDENRSSQRAATLFRESLDLLRAKRRETASAAAAAPGAASAAATLAANTPGANPPPSDSGPGPARPPRPADRGTIDPIQVSLASVREVQAVESGPFAGTISLTLRSPQNGSERDWLREQVAAAVPFPVMPSLEDVPLTIDAIPQTAASGRNWSWPEGALAEVSFSPSIEPPGPRRLLRAQALLPTLVLMEGALAKKTLNESLVLLGDLDPVSLQPILPGDPIAAIEKGGAMGRPYLLVPATIFENLVTYLQKSGRLELLFKSELISYTDLGGAITRLTSPDDPALAAASAEFGKIEAASANLPLPDLARNAAAQDRLRSLLTSFPDHLSARAMLEFGVRPVTQEVLLSQFVAKIDGIVAPFLPLEDNGDTVFDMERLLEAAGSQFLKLRAEAPVETRALLGAAEDLVEEAELYLQLTNKDTSIAVQRLRETREAIAVFESERVKLGIEATSSL